jgi:hypothetical protein
MEQVTLPAQANWKAEWQGDVARLHDHIYIGPEGIAEQDGQRWPVDLYNLRTSCCPWSRSPTRTPFSSPRKPA